jgi:hypothetical protein
VGEPAGGVPEALPPLPVIAEELPFIAEKLPAAPVIADDPALGRADEPPTFACAFCMAGDPASAARAAPAVGGVVAEPPALGAAVFPASSGFIAIAELLVPRQKWPSLTVPGGQLLPHPESATAKRTATHEANRPMERSERK